MPEAAASSSLPESAKEGMPTMGFLDHLEELRKRIVYSIVAVIIGFIGCWFSAGRLVDIMQRPIIRGAAQIRSAGKTRLPQSRSTRSIST